MNDKLNEELSALTDGEVSEFGLRKILCEMDEKPELARKWSRYHMTKAALRNEVVVSVDLSESIKAALSEELPHNLGEKEDRRDTLSVSLKDKFNKKRAVGDFLYSLGKPLSSVALTASVTLAAVLSWQEFRSSSEPVQEPVIAATSQPVLDSKAYPSPSRAALVTQTVSTQSVARPSALSRVPSTSSLQAISPAVSEQRMQVYMISHANYGAVVNGSGMIPFARLTSAGEK